MIAVLEYIVQNYTWFLGGAILILLAIIGGYADKTNFGQGKSWSQNNSKGDESPESLEKIANTGLNTLIENVTEDEAHNSLEEKIESEEQKNLDSNIEIINSTLEDKKTTPIDLVGQTNEKLDSLLEDKPIQDNNSQMVIQQKEENYEKREEELYKFNEEFNSIIPKKEIINEELLEDIDSLSLDKTQKFDFRSVPDLDDVELPKIKSLIDDTDEDIWKH